MIQDLIQISRGALTFEDGAFARMRDAPDGFQKALLLVVVVSLLVGLIASGIGLIHELTQPPLEVQFEKIERGIEQGLASAEQFGAEIDPKVRAQILSNVREGLQIGRRVAQVAIETMPLPLPVSNLFEALGKWASAPFNWLGTWMLYGLIVLIIAKLLGGTATIQEMLSTTSLAVVPHVLDAFGPLLGLVPYIGGLAATALGLVTLVWGLAIYVKATATANRFSIGKSLVAVLLPIALVLLIGLIVGLFILVTIATAIGSAR